QSLSLFAGAKRANLAARVGYQFDIGPSTFEQENSSFTDRQDAVLLGVSGRYPLGRTVVFASAESYLTLNAKTNGMSYDLGDLYGLNGGVGYDLGFGEIGAALTFRYRTDGKTVAAVDDQAFSVTTPSGYQFGIAPYVTVSPGSSPFSFYVKGGVQDEYRDYSLSITGENDLAPHLGATFGVVYGL
ncbi:MAG TPA: hypothetical protein VFG50_15725, partial [Rhodothermales bacterium]|nr:hypothetical protein [Rhodothermales bacterium]